jgi:magnesium chelatase family protein
MMNEEKAQITRIGAPLSGEPHPALQWIEIASFLQIPSFQIIGLPAPEVAEARERVRAAIEASGLDFPRRRVVANLSPAHIRKRGTGVDLALALAVLHESYGVARSVRADTVVAWGELGLDGIIKPAGSLTRAAYAAWEGGADRMIVACDELNDARDTLAWIRESRLLPGTGPRILGAESLLDAWAILKEGGEGAGAAPGNPAENREISKTGRSDWKEWAETGDSAEAGSMLLPISGSMERVLGAAAAGAHHLILLGPRGTGKSQAMEWLAALQPPAEPAARVRHALLEELSPLSGRASFESHAVRRVSAQARPSALIGGATASAVRPGEFSLAHGGLLMADEFPEWARDAREALREPLERGMVTVTRANRAVELPARFTLAANGNLCPCGGWPRELPRPPLASPGASAAGTKRPPRCKCGESAKRAYLARLSGPILDRIDLVVLVEGLGNPREAGEPDSVSQLRRLRHQVSRARSICEKRWGGLPGQLPAVALEKLLEENPSWRPQLDPAKFSSFRARHKVLRVALTLTAWEEAAEPGFAQFAEAMMYRPERFFAAES